MKKAVQSILIIAVSIALISCFSSCQQKKQSNQTIIGVIVPLTGDVSVFGISCQNAMKIIVEQEKEFLEKNNIKVIYEDEKGSTKDALNALNKLIASDNSIVNIAGGSSASVLAMAPFTEKNNRILLASFASSPLITYAGDNVFRIMPSDAYQASLLPMWMKEFNYKRIGVIYEKNDWGLALKDAFIKDFKAGGGEIVFLESIEENQKDYKNVITKLKKEINTCDAIFLPVYTVEGGLLIKQIKEFKINKPIFGGDMFANQLLIETGGKAAEGVMFMAPSQYKGKEYMEFEQKYMAKYNKEPDLPASAGYDALSITLLSMKELVKGNKPITADNLKAFFYNNVDFWGATGNTKFDKNGDPVSKTFARRIIKDGKIVEYQK